MTGSLKYLIMKNLLFSCCILFSVALSAQNKEAVQYEKQGALVKATRFHDNGAIAQQGTYLNGKLHGEWKMYNQEGEKLAMGTYQLGAKTGKWFFWEGEALKEVDFINNEMAAIREWDSKGTVVLNK